MFPNNHATFTCLWHKREGFHRFSRPYHNITQELHRQQKPSFRLIIALPQDSETVRDDREKGSDCPRPAGSSSLEKGRFSWENTSENASRCSNLRWRRSKSSKTAGRRALQTNTACGMNQFKSNSPTTRSCVIVDIDIARFGGHACILDGSALRNAHMEL